MCWCCWPTASRDSFWHCDSSAGDSRTSRRPISRRDSVGHRGGMARAPHPSPSSIPASRSGRAGRAVLSLLGAVALYAALLGLAAPPIVQRLAEKRLGETLGRKVSIDDVTVN